MLFVFYIFLHFPFGFWHLENFGKSSPFFVYFTLTKDKGALLTVCSELCKIIY